MSHTWRKRWRRLEVGVKRTEMTQKKKAEQAKPM